MDTKKLLFYSQQTIDSDDINEVVKALKSELITTGPYVEKFEKKIAKLTGSKYAVACSSGTAALIMAYNAIDNKNHNRVLVPSMTFVGTANAAKIYNAVTSPHGIICAHSSSQSMIVSYAITVPCIKHAPQMVNSSNNFEPGKSEEPLYR